VLLVVQVSTTVRLPRGHFFEGDQIVVDFSIESVVLHQPEIGSGMHNGRGAAQDAQRRTLRKNGRRDQIAWSILNTEWLQAKAVWGPKVH
jgi:hypothetical protein